MTADPSIEMQLFRLVSDSFPSVRAFHGIYEISAYSSLML